MTIEISDSKCEYVYRVNVFQPRCIDFRRNKPGARWLRYPAEYPTTMAAIEALLELRKQAKQESE